MDGHDPVAHQEEIDLLGDQSLFTAGHVVGNLEDDEQVVFVIVDLRRRRFGDDVLDRQRVEPEVAGQNV